MKKHFLVLCFGLMLISYRAQSQGCTPIRSLTGFGQLMVPEANQEPVKWLVNVNSRYFNSSNTFIGSSNKDKNGNPNEPLGVNNVYSVNFGIARLLEKGWAITVDLPYMAADRTGYIEHSGPTADPNKTQYTSHTFGLGDIRITGYKWLFNTSVPHKGNIQVGLGLKLATGDYRYQDYFHKDYTQPLVTTLAPVNQSIQLGDGGTGFTIELNGYYALNKTVSLYGNLFYLSNPRDQNGVSSTWGGTPSTNLIKAGGQVNTVPDAYTMRAGANFTVKKYVFWLGARKEGVPVYDLIGGSNGVRRPGTAMSIEPGINYKHKNSVFYAFVPIVIYRNAFQSVPDKNISSITGVYQGSPAAFANYLFFVGVMFKIPAPSQQKVF